VHVRGRVSPSQDDLRPGRTLGRRFEEKAWLLATLFLGGFLILGVCVFDDYGAHWDEIRNQRFGERWSDYAERVLSKGPSEARVPHLGHHDFTHGPAFEMSLQAVEALLLPSADAREVVLLRHLLTFLTFLAGAACFTLLCRSTFESWGAGLLGFLLLALHPRLFSHAFYNSVDIPFLVLYTMGACTLVLLLDRPSVPRAVLHALTSALAIDIRIAGLVLPLATVVFIGAEALAGRGPWRQPRRGAVILGIHLVALAAFVVSFWPYLWTDPVGGFLGALDKSRFATGVATSWTYNFVWIVGTTPLSYTICMGAGTLLLVARTVRDPWRLDRTHRLLWIAAFLLWVPIVLPIMFGTKLFDGWRHHYFVYPSFALLGVAGVVGVGRLLRQRFGYAAYALLLAVLLLDMGRISLLMVRSHPYQHVYGNALAGDDLSRVKHNGALDYWGLAYREGFEHILAEDSRSAIRVRASHGPGFVYAMLLRPADRERIEFVGDDQQPDYFMTIFRRGGRDRRPDAEAVYTVSAFGEPILAVYKLGPD